ncbi:MAG: restriction endonuclease subunit S, partial [Patescibacteria group bacterium]
MMDIPAQIENDLLDQWDHTTLENGKLFNYLNGLWKGKKPPYVNVKVLRNTNFNNDGTLSLEDVAELPVEEKQFRTRKLIIGDILLERSGGGPKQPVGRVVYFDLSQEDYSFSNFTTCIRVKDEEILIPRFLLYYLLSFYNQGNTNELQQRTTGIRNLNFADYKKITIPLPTIHEQKLIVFILKKLQQAIEQQEQIIAKTKELKRSLMHRLFTYGL